MIPNLEEHCAECYELLRTQGFDEQMIHPIVSHAYGCLDWVTVKPELQMEKRLICSVYMIF